MITGIDMAMKNTPDNSIISAPTRRGMVLPFQPLSLAFNRVNYHVDMPAVSIFSHFSLSLLENCLMVGQEKEKK